MTCEAGPSYTTKREESSEQMMQFVQAFPQAAPMIGDLIAKNLDWPGADDIADRLKAMLPPQAQGQNPMVMQLQQQMQQLQQQAQQQIQQLSQQLQEAQADQQAKQAEFQLKGADIQMKQADMQQSAQQAQQDAQLKAQELQIKQFEAETKRIEVQANIDAERMRLQFDVMTAQAPVEQPPQFQSD